MISILWVVTNAPIDKGSFFKKLTTPGKILGLMNFYINTFITASLNQLF